MRLGIALTTQSPMIPRVMMELIALTEMRAKPVIAFPAAMFAADLFPAADWSTTLTLLISTNPSPALFAPYSIC